MESTKKLFPLNDQQDLEVLKKRYDDLRTRKIQAETNRSTSQKRLEELKAQARRDYQTDDLNELKQKLAEMKAQNEKLRADYQRHLDEIEADLKKVDEQQDVSA